MGAGQVNVLSPSLNKEVTMVANFAQYVVRHNPSGASELLVQQYGMPRTRSMRKMVEQMKYIIRTYRKDALNDIARIHPDKELITDLVPVQVEEEVETVSNCDGCEKLKEASNACGCGHSNASGGCDCGCNGKCGESNADGENGGDAAIEAAKATQPTMGMGVTPVPLSKNTNAVGTVISYAAVAVLGALVASALIKQY